jgi:hypothetical protein
MQRKRQATTVGRRAGEVRAVAPSPAWLLAVSLMVMLQPVQAGDLLTPERLAQESDVLVVVAVILGPISFEVDLVEVLFVAQPAATGVPIEELQPALAAGPCLPDRATLAAWLARPAGTTAARAQWLQAMSSGAYSAVLALRATAAGLAPLCETETLLAEHWLGHPDHPAWRERLDATLALASDAPIDCPPLD